MRLPVEGRLGKSLACGQWLAGPEDEAEASEIAGFLVELGCGPCSNQTHGGQVPGSCSPRALGWGKSVVYWLVSGCENTEQEVGGQGRSRRRRTTETQKTPSVGAGRAGVLRHRVDFSKEAFGVKEREPSLCLEASDLSVGVYVQLKTCGCVCIVCVYVHASSWVLWVYMSLCVWAGHVTACGCVWLSG